ncbi:MAG: hypothetical protein FWD76_02465 [Firmicutes bacterium]|nr:hypothetical protein [Bacillota bacterium]
MNFVLGTMLSLMGAVEYVKWITLGFVVSFVAVSIAFGVTVLVYNHKRNKQRRLLGQTKQVVPD